MLWLVLHFPLWPLEAQPLRQSPSAVVSRGRVLVADGAAQQAGVIGGQKLSTALGLQPGLTVFERDEKREQDGLDHLACWAGRFTPTVSLAQPSALRLEIGSCLRLFGGVQAIVDAVLEGCAEQACSVRWAVAPTPLGAHWLAMADARLICHDLSEMAAALAVLPCDLPDWSPEISRRLDAFGLKSLGEMRRLPSAGLHRRLGEGPINDLARAWGELPDPQRSYVFPESFEQKIELPSRVEHAEALAFVGQRLFAALAGWLGVRQLLVRSCRLLLTHDDGAVSELLLRFAEPAADEARFVRLLREHLGRLTLSGPVEALCLKADEVIARPGGSVPLFAQAATGEGTLVCLERLQARLGAGAVHVLGHVPDYRPECATREINVLSNLASQSTSTVALKPDLSGAARPLWLLPAPQALVEQAGSPCWHGPLKLLSRAERLESGWWDEGETLADAARETKLQASGDLRRDYFVARNPQGQWAWIFRDAGGWFLHGLFA